jgi:hypothetical protein
MVLESALLVISLQQPAIILMLMEYALFVMSQVAALILLLANVYRVKTAINLSIINV